MHQSPVYLLKRDELPLLLLCALAFSIFQDFAFSCSTLQGCLSPFCIFFCLYFAVRLGLICLCSFRAEEPALLGDAEVVGQLGQLPMLRIQIGYTC